MSHKTRAFRPHVKGEPMIAGLIYAGGQATRLGGLDKPLLALAGVPLVAWSLARLAPQVERVAIVTRGDPARFAGFPADVIVDPQAAQTPWGPIGGLLAGLEWARGVGAMGLATAPADAPFLPTDLVARLAAAGSCAMAEGPTGKEPACALWPVAQAHRIADLANSGERALWAIAKALDAAPVVFPNADPPPFFNINTPHDVISAEAVLACYSLRPPRFWDEV
jgi:molybdopterin-guanine dinucleotide biosynthesis protein A